MTIKVTMMTLTCACWVGAKIIRPTSTIVSFYHYWQADSYITLCQCWCAILWPHSHSLHATNHAEDVITISLRIRELLEEVAATMGKKREVVNCKGVDST